MSFENNIQTEFEYNLQFLNNNKQYSIRSQSHQNEKQNHLYDKQRHLNETNEREKGNSKEQLQHQQKQEQIRQEEEQQQQHEQPQQVRDSEVQPTDHYFSDTNLENAHNRPHKYNFDKTIIGTWFSWLWPQQNANEKKMQIISSDSNYDDNRIDADETFIERKNKIVPKNYEILNSFGESWEICRPCTDVEMVETFCSSEYGN